jgi:hypothetical protein
MGTVTMLILFFIVGLATLCFLSYTDTYHVPPDMQKYMPGYKSLINYIKKDKKDEGKEDEGKDEENEDEENEDEENEDEENEDEENEDEKNGDEENGEVKGNEENGDENDMDDVCDMGDVNANTGRMSSNGVCGYQHDKPCKGGFALFAPIDPASDPLEPLYLDKRCVIDETDMQSVDKNTLPYEGEEEMDGGV